MRLKDVFFVKQTRSFFICKKFITGIVLGSFLFSQAAPINVLATDGPALPGEPGIVDSYVEYLEATRAVETGQAALANATEFSPGAEAVFKEELRVRLLEAQQARNRLRNAVAEKAGPNSIYVRKDCPWKLIKNYAENYINILEQSGALKPVLPEGVSRRLTNPLKVPELTDQQARNLAYLASDKPIEGPDPKPAEKPAPTEKPASTPPPTKPTTAPKPSFFESLRRASIELGNFANVVSWLSLAFHVWVENNLTPEQRLAEKYEALRSAVRGSPSDSHETLKKKANDIVEAHVATLGGKGFKAADSSIVNLTKLYFLITDEEDNMGGGRSYRQEVASVSRSLNEDPLNYVLDFGTAVNLSANLATQRPKDLFLATFGTQRLAPFLGRMDDGSVFMMPAHPFNKLWLTDDAGNFKAAVKDSIATLNAETIAQYPNGRVVFENIIYPRLSTKLLEVAIIPSELTLDEYKRLLRSGTKDFMETIQKIIANPFRDKERQGYSATINTSQPVTLMALDGSFKLDGELHDIIDLPSGLSKINLVNAGDISEKHAKFAVFSSKNNSWRSVKPRSVAAAKKGTALRRTALRAPRRGGTPITPSETAASAFDDWRIGHKTPDVIGALSSFIKTSSYKTVLNSYLSELDKLRRAGNNDKIYGLGVLNTRLSRERSLPASFKNSVTELFRHGINILYGNTQIASCVLNGKASQTTINRCNEQGGAVSAPCTATGGVASLKTVPVVAKELSTNPSQNWRDPKGERETKITDAIKKAGIPDEAYIISKNDCDDFAMKAIDVLRKLGYEVSRSTSAHWWHAFVDVHIGEDVIFVDPHAGEGQTKIYKAVPKDTISVLDDPTTPQDEMEEAQKPEDEAERKVEELRQKLEEEARQLDEADKKLGKSVKRTVEHRDRNSSYEIKTRIIEPSESPFTPSTSVTVPISDEPTTPSGFTPGPGHTRPVLGPY